MRPQFMPFVVDTMRNVGQRRTQRVSLPVHVVVRLEGQNAECTSVNLRKNTKANQDCVTLSRVTGGCFCHAVRVGQKVHN